VSFGSELWEVDRPLVTTKTAIVSLSRREAVDADDGGDEELIVDALRLPAERSTATEPVTYMEWLLDQLGIPSVAVPRARTDVTSESSPVTINDWLLYCIVRDDEIDTMVFGLRTPSPIENAGRCSSSTTAFTMLRSLTCRLSFGAWSSAFRTLTTPTKLFGPFSRTPPSPALMTLTNRRARSRS
jgi:hypothetical protein